MPRTPKLLFLIFTLIGCLLLTINHIDGYSLEMKDAYEYQYAGENLVSNQVNYAGIGFDESSEELDFRLFSKRPPFYPLIRVVNKYPLLISLLQVALILLTYFVGLSLIKTYGNKRRLFRLFSLAYFLSLSIVFIPHFGLADSTLLALVSLMCLLFLRKNYFVLGILWGAALLLKPVILPSVILSLVLFVYLSVKKMKTKQTITLLIPVLIFVFASLINAKTTGVFQYSSISTINMSNYNAKLLIANNYGSDSAEKFVSGRDIKIPNSKAEYIAYNKTLLDRSKAVIKDDVAGYMKVHIIGMIKCFVDPGRFELYTALKSNDAEFSLTELLFSGNIDLIMKAMNKSKIGMFVFLAFLLIGLIKLVGFIRTVFSMSAFRLTCLGVVFYFVFISGPIGASRFMMPGILAYSLLVAFGWNDILNFFKKGSKT